MPKTNYWPFHFYMQISESDYESMLFQKVFFTCHAKDYPKPFLGAANPPKKLLLFEKCKKNFYFLHIFLNFCSTRFLLFVGPPLLSCCIISQAYFVVSERIMI